MKSVCLHSWLIAFVYFLGSWNGHAQSPKSASKEDTLQAHKHYKIADSLSQKFDYAPAVIHLQKARSIYEKSANWERAAHCLNTLAKNQLQAGYYPKAYTAAQEALEIANRIQNNYQKAQALRHLGKYYWFFEYQFAKALEHYQKALSLYQKEGKKNTLEILVAYQNIGLLHYRTGNRKAAIGVIAQGLDLALKTYGENHTRTAYLYLYKGYLNKYKNPKLTLTLLEKSARIWRRLHKSYHPDMETLYKHFLIAYIDHEDYQKALHYAQKTMETMRHLYRKDHPKYTSIYYKLGLLYLRKGNYEKSLEYYHEALDIAHKTFTAKHPKIALSYIGIANNLIFKGAYNKAQQYYQGAANILSQYNRESYFELSLATIYNNIGVRYQKTKEFEKSLTYFEKSLAIRYRILGDQHQKIAQSHNNIGAVHRALQDYEQALVHLQKARVLYSKTNIDLEDAYEELGHLYRDQGMSQKAIAFYTKAARIHAKMHNHRSPDLAEIYNYIAALHYDKHTPQKALRYYQKAQLANTIPSREAIDTTSFDPQQAFNGLVLLETLTGQAKSLQALFQQHKIPSYLQQSKVIYQKADTLISHLRGTFQKYEDKIDFSKKTKILFTDALQAHGYAFEHTDHHRDLEQAFYYAEKSKANTLQELLRSNKATNFAGVDPALLKLEHDLQRDRAFFQSQISVAKLQKKIDSTKRKKLTLSLLECNRRRDSLLLVLEKKYPKYHQLKHQQQPITVAQIQKQLQDATTLLEFFTTDSTTYAFVISKQHFALQKIKTPQLADNIDRLRTAITTKNTLAYKDQALALYQQLIAPLSEQLQGDQLLIVPDGALWHLNFDLLLTRPHRANNPAKLPYLMKDYAISYANAAQLLFDPPSKNQRNPKKTAQAQKECLAFSFSDTTHIAKVNSMSLATLRNSKKDLPGTRKEISAIADIVDGNYYYGSQAIEANFKKKAPQYNILHLALHGEVDHQNPQKSRLFFTKTKDTLEDSYLYPHELFALDIPADLTVLSACNTGTGKIAKGEGIMSLGNAFQYAGTKSLLLSSWEVSDRTTPLLMQLFYQNLKQGRNKSKALQQAKLQYLKNVDPTQTAPFYWGGFYLLGDPTPIPFAKDHSLYWGIGIAMLALLILGVLKRYWNGQNLEGQAGTQ